MRVGIYGAGGFGRELVQPLRLAHPEVELVFIDDAEADEPTHLPVLRLSDMARGDRFLVAQGNGETRARLERACLDAGLVPHTFVDRSAHVGPGVEIGGGGMICGNTLVTVDCRIGRSLHLNWYGTVGHDCAIGDYVSIGPKAMILGNVHLGDFAYIGASATVRNGTPEKPLRIGEGATVGMGAVVIKDVPPRTTVVGNPARPIERRTGAAA